MISKLKSFLDKNHRYLNKKQAQQIFLYIMFVLRFCKIQQINIKTYIKSDNDLESLLPRLFQDVSGYEVKDAAIVFDEYMPWNVLRQEPCLYERIKNLLFELHEDEFASGYWLYNQVKEILNFETGDDIEVTPNSIRNLISKLASQKQADQIVNCCCGTFLLGLAVWKAMGRKENISCYGEEFNPYLCAFSRLMLFLCGVKDFSVKEMDILNSIEFDGNDKLSRVFTADIPLAGNRTIHIPQNDHFLSKQKKHTLYADWVMIYNILKRVNTGDSAFLLITKGALVRENERFMREYLIESDYVDAVISFPSGLYPNRNLPMELLVCEKGRASERCGKVLFVDVSKLESQNRMLSEESIDVITEVFQKYTANEKFAKIVTAEAIRLKEYNLHPPIYLADDDILTGQLHIKDIARVTRGLQEGHKSLEQFLLNVRNIQDGEIKYDCPEERMKENPGWEEKYLIKEDDIILTAKGTILKIAIVPPNPPPAYISGNLMILRVNPAKYHPYVLYEYLRSDNGRQALSLIQTGTTIRVLGIKTTEQLAIPDYDYETAVMVGNSLKLSAIKYRQSLDEINKRYQTEKEELLIRLLQRKEK